MKFSKGQIIGAVIVLVLLLVFAWAQSCGISDNTRLPHGY